jgi:hypothetical protein
MFNSSSGGDIAQADLDLKQFIITQETEIEVLNITSNNNLIHNVNTNNVAVLSYSSLNDITII